MGLQTCRGLPRLSRHLVLQTILCCRRYALLNLVLYLQAPASPPRVEIRGIHGSWTHLFFHASFTFIPLLSAVIRSERSDVVGEETALFPYRFPCSILCFCFFLFKVSLYPVDGIQVVCCYSNSPT